MPVGVGHEVAQGDAQQSDVGDETFGGILVHVIRHSPGGELSRQSFQQRREVARGRPQFGAWFAHAVLGEVVVHQGQQALGGAADVAAARQGLLGGRRQVACQLLGRGRDDGQRRAEFMRDQGDEVALLGMHLPFMGEHGTQFHFELLAPHDFGPQLGGAVLDFRFQPLAVLALQFQGSAVLGALAQAAPALMAADDPQAQQNHVDHGAQGRCMLRPGVEGKDIQVAQKADHHSQVEHAEDRKKQPRRPPALAGQPAAGQAGEHHDEQQRQQLHRQHGPGVVEAGQQHAGDGGCPGRADERARQPRLEGGQRHLAAADLHGDAEAGRHAQALQQIAPVAGYAGDLLDQAQADGLVEDAAAEISQGQAAAWRARDAPEQAVQTDEQQVKTEVQAKEQALASRLVVESEPGPDRQPAGQIVAALQPHEQVMAAIGRQREFEGRAPVVHRPVAARHILAARAQPLSGAILPANVDANIVEHRVAQAEDPAPRRCGLHVQRQAPPGARS
ncbi:MAG: hypothetical protein GAK38_00553 [Xylophilus sp.]|nr:MAG: hypothetical protein GAK38_00553 [Xylophilus sp.]